MQLALIDWEPSDDSSDTSLDLFSRHNLVGARDTLIADEDTWACDQREDLVLGLPTKAAILGVGAAGFHRFPLSA